MHALCLHSMHDVRVGQSVQSNCGAAELFVILDKQPPVHSYVYSLQGKLTTDARGQPDGMGHRHHTTLSCSTDVALSISSEPCTCSSSNYHSIDFLRQVRL
jgi:hypothetical protein